ncbi:glycosyltransferase [Enterococcus olivae]
MLTFYWIILVSFVFFFLLRWRLADLYVKQTGTSQRINEKNYTVLQPILSGDPRLEEDLRANLLQTSEMFFIWLVDKSDPVAQEITATILKEADHARRVRVVLLDDVPQEVNPKVYKLKQVIREIQTEYFIVLDDDSVFNRKRLDEMSHYEKRTDEWIVTGIPYNDGQTGIWSKLVAAFVNSNSLLTYFSMARVQANQTINGMFYISRTETFCRLNVFERVQYELCDDLAVAAFLQRQGVKIIQSRIPCNVRNTVLEPKKYVLLMKRWLLFAAIYMKTFPSLALFLLVIVPSFLPGLLLLFSLFLGWKFLVTSLLLFIGKALLLSQFRNKVLEQKEKNRAIFYEVLNDLLLPVLFIYTIMTPPIIQWRNKKIKVTDGKIRYV